MNAWGGTIMYATLSFLEARYDETIVIIAGHCGIRFGDSPTNTNPLPSDSWHSKQIADQNFIPRLPQTHLLFGIIPTLKSNVSALFVSVFSNGHRPLNSRWKPLTTVERKESGMLAFPPPPCAPPQQLSKLANEVFPMFVLRAGQVLSLAKQHVPNFL